MYSIDMVEFASSSAGKSGAFLEQAFGWTRTSYGPDYVDVQGGGISLGFQSDAAEQPSAPLVVIRAEDLDEARVAIEAAGGAVTVEPFDFPGGRRFHFREPGGSELAVWRRRTDNRRKHARRPIDIRRDVGGSRGVSTLGGCGV